MSSTKRLPDNIALYEAELEDISRAMQSHKDDQVSYHDFYKYSAFYGKTGGQDRETEKLYVNYLKTFANKNIFYTSKVPSVQVVPSGTEENDRIMADIREKAVYATYQQNNVALLQRKWSRDGTLLAGAVAETNYNHKTKCVEIKRHDVRHCYWQYADENGRRVLVFYVAYPMTKDAVKKRFGKDVGDGGLSAEAFGTNMIQRLDGKEYVMYVRRLTGTTRAVWAGDTWIERPHKHMLGELPIDIAIPFDDLDIPNYGAFYLRDLVPIQAEINVAKRKKSNIVRRLGNPTVWGRGIIRQQFTDVKEALEGTGGFVGLKGQGELGLLTVPETNMIDNHIADLYQDMQRISGFGQASFGESVGANTSGDALSMYFTPTTRAIEDQQIAWQSFYEGINSKILKFYEKFLGKNGKELYAYLPHGTLMSVESTDNGTTYKNGVRGQSFTLTKEAIGGNYHTVVKFASPTPKDEIAYKRLLMEANEKKLLSKDTALEEWGIQSPPDEVSKIRSEQGDPELNPEGTTKLLDSATKYDQAQANAQPPAGDGLGLPEGVQDAPVGSILG